MIDLPPWLTQFGHTLGPSLIVILAVVFVVKLLSRPITSPAKNQRMHRQLLIFVSVLVGLVGLVLTLPLESNIRGQLLTLLGLVITAVLTLSSPTVAANAMAGFMLRTVKGFAPGDFIQVDQYFGRVTEQGLFHTEIQTQDRDLLTLPNLYLANHPIKVVHASGTIVSADVSLGYDVDHHIIEELLVQAAEQANLEDAFVYVTSLGDFSVNYRVSGFLKQVKHLLSARSLLRKQMMDHLHHHEIEIVSPNFMNQRQIREDIIPQRSFVRADNAEGSEPENRVFDKAERAQQVEELKNSYEEIKTELAGITDEDLKNKRLRRLKAIKRAIAMLERE
ncbi:MAG: mechanosensitive ion channel domain-containing protein [Cellvibrionaceae bacterium]